MKVFTIWIEKYCSTIVPLYSFFLYFNCAISCLNVSVVNICQLSYKQTWQN